MDRPSTFAPPIQNQTNQMMDAIAANRRIVLTISIFSSGSKLPCGRSFMQIPFLTAGQKLGSLARAGSSKKGDEHGKREGSHSQPSQEASGLSQRYP
jgi:hypothetical protein